MNSNNHSHTNFRVTSSSSEYQNAQGVQSQPQTASQAIQLQGKPLGASRDITLNYLLSKEFFTSKNFQVTAIGVSIGLVLAYTGYRWLTRSGKQPAVATEDPALAGLSQTERSKRFIKLEMQRLRDPKLIDGHSTFDGSGILERRDFFDLLLLIQLKTKLKLQKEVQRNQRERIKLLEAAMNPAPAKYNQFGDAAVKAAFERYMERTMEIMLNEFEAYEDQFGKILMSIGISNDTWEASREQYIQAPETTIGGGEESMIHSPDDLSIESIDKRVYEYLPQPNIPKSLTKEKAKSMMIDVNHRSSDIFKKLLRVSFNDNESYSPDCEPLFMETLAYDLALVEYGVNETVFRFAIHKYNLQKDPEIKEYLEGYLTS